MGAFRPPGAMWAMVAVMHRRGEVEGLDPARDEGRLWEGA